MDTPFCSSRALGRKDLALSSPPGRKRGPLDYGVDTCQSPEAARREVPVCSHPQEDGERNSVRLVGSPPIPPTLSHAALHLAWLVTFPCTWRPVLNMRAWPHLGFKDGPEQTGGLRVLGCLPSQWPQECHWLGTGPSCGRHVTGQELQKMLGLPLLWCTGLCAGR